MSSKLTISPLEFNHTVLKNVLRMLKDRKLIKNVDDLFDKIKPDSISKNKVFFEENGNKFGILLYPATLKSISKKSSVDDFLSDNIKIYKFLIVGQITKKVFKSMREFPNSEIFTYTDFVEYKMDKDFVCKHEIISKEEKTMLSEFYDLKDLPIIYQYDFMSRYYGAKIGDVLRVYRKNPNSGESINYRIVTKGNIDLFF